MSRFDQIKEALEYIDGHLEEAMSLESLAQRFHFSPYYFHRMFSAIVGKSLAIHIRDRRLMRACIQLLRSDKSVLEIGLDCGYQSAQAFSRAFRGVYGLSPRAYRGQGLAPVIITVEEMIMKFTNRLRGGIDLNPKIIRRGAIYLLGVSGDGNRTGEVWSAFEQAQSEKPIQGKLSDHGYEVRLYEEDAHRVFVGLAVGQGMEDPAYSRLELPPSEYACFDVYVAKGYDSENTAMEEWLQSNEQGYRERLLGRGHYCVEYYDERFHGSEAGSIVEIWIPIERKDA